MKYLNTSALGTPQIDEDLIEFVIKTASEGALPPKSRRILASLAPDSENSNNMDTVGNMAKADKNPFLKYPKDSSKIFSLKYRVFDDKYEEALRRAAILSAKLIISQFLYVFMIKSMNKYGAFILDKNKKNTKMIAAIQKEVDAVYKKCPTYSPCSIESFARSSYWKRMTAKYRDKSAKDIAELFGWKTLNAVVRTAVRHIWKSPFSKLIVPPVKIMLAFVGVPFGIGTVCNLAFSIDDGKNTIGIGLDFKPSGFRISSLVLFTWSKDRRLIQTKLTPPPYNTYRISTKDAKEIMEKFRDGDLQQLKEEYKKYKEGVRVDG